VTCRHARICDVSNQLAGMWSTVRRCVDCYEALPMGPAMETEAVLDEVLAAEVALAYDERLGPAVALCMAPSSDERNPYIGAFGNGWRGDGGSWEQDERSYAIGALARAIWDASKEAA
jgi:hypothetical protein